ncbi:MAG: rod shape-determining protein RodA [Bacteroidota bacterium]|nr:rod shape-determining protein RodA [Bacteroidota bacterium]|tara:strand:- start:2296 stop:3558 length:1263 start_codon:yes stop_codon:yes gene_type:complete
MRKINISIFSNDIIITLCYIILVFFGFISIYSSQYSEELPFVSLKNESFKQLIWILICLIIFFIIQIIEYRFIFDLAVPLYFLSIILLVLVLLFGQEVKSSVSWFNFFGLKFQPSEFAKFSTALILAKVFDSSNLKVDSVKSLIKVSTLILIPFILILFQGDTGTALVYFSFFLVLLREGLSLKFFFIALSFIVIFMMGIILEKTILYTIFTILFLIIVGLSIKDFKRIINSSIFFVLVILVINGQDFLMNNVLKPHQKKRIESLINPNADPLGAGWNVTQSKIAIGSGSFLGKGYMEGSQTSFNFVPFQSTDFIFSVIGEEFGYLGSMIFIILYFIFLYRVLILAENQKDKFARVFGYSVFSIIFFHFFVNISMTLGLFPVVGIPLPFVSYGGSSLLSFSLLIFIFLKLNSFKPSLLSR